MAPIPVLVLLEEDHQIVKTGLISRFFFALARYARHTTDTITTPMEQPTD